MGHFWSIFFWKFGSILSKYIPRDPKWKKIQKIIAPHSIRRLKLLFWPLRKLTFWPTLRIRGSQQQSSTSPPISLTFCGIQWHCWQESKQQLCNGGLVARDQSLYSTKSVSRISTAKRTLSSWTLMSRTPHKMHLLQAMLSNNHLVHTWKNFLARKQKNFFRTFY